MPREKSARVLLYYTLPNHSGKSTKINPLLVRETRGMYELPGGSYRGDPKVGAQRELEEELGLAVHLNDLVFAYEFRGKRIDHTIFVARRVRPVRGRALHINYETVRHPSKSAELLHIGFLPVGNGERIDDRILENHVRDPKYGLRAYVEEHPPREPTQGLCIHPKDLQPFSDHRKIGWDRDWRPRNEGLNV